MKKLLLPLFAAATISSANAQISETDSLKLSEPDTSITIKNHSLETKEDSLKMFLWENFEIETNAGGVLSFEDLQKFDLEAFQLWLILDNHINGTGDKRILEFLNNFLTSDGRNIRGKIEPGETGFLFEGTTWANYGPNYSFQSLKWLKTDENRAQVKREEAWLLGLDTKIIEDSELSLWDNKYYVFRNQYLYKLHQSENETSPRSLLLRDRDEHKLQAIKNAFEQGIYRVIVNQGAFHALDISKNKLGVPTIQLKPKKSHSKSSERAAENILKLAKQMSDSVEAQIDAHQNSDRFFQAIDESFTENKELFRKSGINGYEDTKLFFDWYDAVLRGKPSAVEVTNKIQTKINQLGNKLKTLDIQINKLEKSAKARWRSQEKSNLVKQKNLAKIRKDYFSSLLEKAKNMINVIRNNQNIANDKTVESVLDYLNSTDWKRLKPFLTE